MVWSHRVTEIEGRRVQVLIDERFRDSAPIKELPRIAWFGVYGNLDPGEAFWHPDETATLDAIENGLIGLCDSFGRGWVVYVMRVDTRGIREYYFYYGHGAEIEKVLHDLQSAHPNHKIEFDQKDDPEWERYTTFLPA
jgi:hypothetical protein